MSELKIGAIYVCKAKKLLQHGVIISVGDNQEGFIHISELSKRWVRDVKDIVKEGDQIVCKLIKQDQQTAEFSAKRVTDNEKRQALKEWSVENRINHIIEKASNKDAAGLGQKIKEKYGSMYGFYDAILKNGKTALNELKVSKELTDALLDFVEKTKKKITIKTELFIQDFGDDGIDNIKKLLLEPYSNKNNYSIRYIKAPNYLITVNAGDTKKTISENKKILDGLETKSKQLGIEFKYKELKE